MKTQNIIILIFSALFISCEQNPKSSETAVSSIVASYEITESIDPADCTAKFGRNADGYVGYLKLTDSDKVYCNNVEMTTHGDTTLPSLWAYNAKANKDPNGEYHIVLKKNGQIFESVAKTTPHFDLVTPTEGSRIDRTKDLRIVVDNPNSIAGIGVKIETIPESIYSTGLTLEPDSQGQGTIPAKKFDFPAEYKKVRITLYNESNSPVHGSLHHRSSFTVRRDHSYNFLLK